VSASFGGDARALERGIRSTIRGEVVQCRRFDAPVLPRGAGTSQCCNLAVVLDFSRYMNRVVPLDPDARSARVETGRAPLHLAQILEEALARDAA
jgi:FAD/FMN-containing dehydrogenase